MMGFIEGQLAHNKDGATYDHIVYDRWLSLRLLSGREIIIFDPAEPISSGLRVGEIYEMILVPLVVNVTVLSSEQSEGDFDGWQGTVIDTHWKAIQDFYRLARPELYTQEWVLIAALQGHLIVNPRDIKQVLKEGMIVQWTTARLDLYALI